MRRQIVQDCINNIKEFGYPYVDNKNIFTDAIYSRFFKRILEDNLGKDAFVDCAIMDLLKEINKEDYSE